MKEDKKIKGYYTILTEKVRYDKNLSWFSKVLFSEISSLTSKLGYCWATNEGLGDKLGVSKTTVIRAISDLKKTEYIKTFVVDRNKRKIWTTDKMYFTDKEMSEKKEEEISKNDIPMSGKNDIPMSVKNATPTLMSSENATPECQKRPSRGGENATPDWQKRPHITKSIIKPIIKFTTKEKKLVEDKKEDKKEEKKGFTFSVDQEGCIKKWNKVSKSIKEMKKFSSGSIQHLLDLDKEVLPEFTEAIEAIPYYIKEKKVVDANFPVNGFGVSIFLLNHSDALIKYFQDDSGFTEAKKLEDLLNPVMIEKEKQKKVTVATEQFIIQQLIGLCRDTEGFKELKEKNNKFNTRTCGDPKLLKGWKSELLKFAKNNNLSTVAVTKELPPKLKVVKTEALSFKELNSKITDDILRDKADTEDDMDFSDLDLDNLQTTALR